MKILEKSIRMLLENNPFYAHFFLNSKISYDQYGVPTAAAAVTASGTQMVFNSKFIESLTPEEVCGVIEHEVMHILLDHVSVMRHDDMLDKHVANIAMDCAINQWIRSLPHGSITLDSIKKLTKDPNLEQDQTWEYYYQKLVARKEQLLKMFPLDDHGAGIPGQIKQGAGQEVIRSAVDKAIKSSAGNVPSQVLKVFDALSAECQISWKQILANFVASASSNTTRATRKKSNRRFGIDQPGKLKKRELVLGVCTDSSGSVSDEDYKKFMVEISRISKLCNTTYIIDADCEVQDIQKVTKGRPVKAERRGCGGTAYQPAISECVKMKCDAIVYFGDMDSADHPSDPGKPFLWVIVGGGNPPAKFGSEVRLS